jgi:hypothetical protein
MVAQGRYSETFFYLDWKAGYKLHGRLAGAMQMYHGCLINFSERS